MFKKYQFFSGLALLLITCNLYAATASNASNDCKTTTSLYANQWQIIGIPCEAPENANTVKAIFADDIAGNYGTDWILFGYNPSSNSYENVDLQDVLQVGTGYWIITFTNLALLDMPSGSQPVKQIESTQCISPSCFETTMTSNGTKQWQLVANPFHHSFSWSALRGKVATIKHSCGREEGCTLTEMQTEGFVEDQGWNFDGSAYQPLKGTDVAPWTGMWMVSLNTASNTHLSTLLFPGIKPDSGPNEEFFNLNFMTSPLGEYDIEDIKREWLGVLWAHPNGRVNVIEENGNRFLRVDYPQGGVGPREGGAQWKIDFIKAFGTTYNELYISYKLRFANGFDPVKGGKLPGLFGGQGNTGGHPADGYDGWTARMMWRVDAAPVFYVYHTDMQGNFGDNFYWDEVETQLFPAAEWVQVEHRIVMNTPGNKDGILQGWYNGKLALDKHDMRYRHVNSFAIDGFYFSTFFGGSSDSWAPIHDETIDFDDFIFSTVPITH